MLPLASHLTCLSINKRPMDFEKACEMGWIAKTCHDVGRWIRVSDWVLYALCILRVFWTCWCECLYMSKLYELLAWIRIIKKTFCLFEFFWTRFRLPALRSALLCKAPVDPPWSTCNCTDAWRRVGTIQWLSNDNRTVSNMAAIDDA